MKNMNFFALSITLLLSVSAYADEAKKDPKDCKDTCTKKSAVTKSSEDVGIIEYKIRIYKDTNNHDKGAWEETVKQAIDTIRAAQEENNGEFVDNVCTSIRAVQKNKSEDTGIHGEIQVSIGDGKCPEGYCGEKCACIDRYAGNCPCGIEETNCKNRKDCNRGEPRIERCEDDCPCGVEDKDKGSKQPDGCGEQCAER